MVSVEMSSFHMGVLAQEAMRLCNTALAREEDMKMGSIIVWYLSCCFGGGAVTSVTP